MLLKLTKWQNVSDIGIFSSALGMECLAAPCSTLPPQDWGHSLSECPSSSPNLQILPLFSGLAEMLPALQRLL